MVQAIVEHLQSVFNETGLFQKIFPLCQLINRAAYTFPAHYIGNGSFEDVTLYGKYEGLGYFRQLGDVKISEASFIKTTSCQSAPNDYEYSLLFVACIPKDKADCDNEYTDNDFATALISAIDNVDGLASEIGAISASASITGYKTISSEIIQSEYKGKVIDFDYKYSLIALNISVVIKAKASCFERLCYGQTSN